MNDQPTMPRISPFDAIRRVDEQGNEYWSARELGKLLGYGEYRFFKNALQKAEEACKQSGQAVLDHFVHTHGMVSIGSGAKRKVESYPASRQPGAFSLQVVSGPIRQRLSHQGGPIEVLSLQQSLQEALPFGSIVLFPDPAVLLANGLGIASIGR